MKNKRTPDKNSLITISLLQNKKIAFLFLFIGIYWGYSQNSAVFHIPDSLKKKTYKELSIKINLNYSDSIKVKAYAKAYLHKAKNENDTIKIARSYSKFASINTNNHLSLIYSDSIICLTKDIKHFVYPGFGYILKGINYYNLGKYDLALNHYLIAQKYAKSNNNIEQILYIKNLTGKLKNFLGDYSSALVNFKYIMQQFNQLNENQYPTKNNLYLSTLYSLSNSYLFVKKYDSALIYAKIGLKESFNSKNLVNYYRFISQTGIIAYYQNNFKMALDSLDKALPYETSPNGLLNDYYYRGNIYWKQRKNEKAFYYFSKADSIYNITNDAVPEVRDIQEYFVLYYKNKNDTKNQLKYINRLLHVDSIIANTNRNINKILFKKYDTPLLLSEKEKIISNLKNREQKSLFTIIGLVVFVLIIIIFFIRFYYKQRVLKARFNKLLLNAKKEEPKIIKTKLENEINGVPKKIIESVLVTLDEFENNNKFLDNTLTLVSLSKSLNTNSNYLSKIINHYKKKNFSTYISDLRIAYCIENLKVNTTFKKYTISAIAFEIGFNNVESFSKAFLKKTGLYPSYFIKELEKQIKK